MKRLASSCICANGLCTTLSSIDNESMKVLRPSRGLRPVASHDYRREGDSGIPLRTELSDIRALNLDSNFVSA